MVLGLLRLLRGYVRFSVTGRFPERFINLALRRKVRLWDVIRRGSELSACMYMRDYLRVRAVARDAGVRLKICKRVGLPTVLRRYSDRAGLVIGAAAFVIMVFVMSLFVWSIDITGLETVSECEMRTLLRENGVYIGAFKPALDYPGVSRAIMLSDSRVGWMAVNVTGSYASVEVKEEYPSPEVADIHTPCNVKARRDGRILRVDASQGTTVMIEGSGVVEGQLVVSGVMEDTQGGVRLVHAEAQILAETDYHASFSVPQTVTGYIPSGEVKRRISAELFGLKLPLTVGGVSSPVYLTDETEKAPTPLDVRLPVGLMTRNIFAMDEKKTQLDHHSANELLTRDAYLYEAFVLSHCTVTDRRFRLIRTPDGYTLYADYTCVEDIAYTEPIGTEE